MEHCRFHSPNFSEEIAFLPPWLQPPNFGRGDKDIRDVFLQSSENVSLEQNCRELSSNNGGYNSCHLYLSGESNSCSGTGHSSGDALQLSLNLSQSNNATQITKCEKIETNEPTRSNSKPYLEEQETHIEKKNNSKCTEKDDFALSQTDIEEAIELSIAASEAMVISELALHEPNYSNFHKNGTLQAAIRVKQARNELFFGVKVDFREFSDQENEDADLLFDSDESEMVNAYNDVGLSENLYNFDINSDSIMVPCSINENSYSNLGFKKDQDVAMQGKTNTRKIINGLFDQETSFISESMDTIEKSPLERTIEPQIEMIGSSNSPFIEIIPKEGSFSSIDPLCSHVPCSIEISKEKISIDPQPNVFSSQNAPDSYGVVTRKRVSSLKPYSKLCEDSNFVYNDGFGNGNLKFACEKEERKKKVKFLEVEIGEKETKITKRPPTSKSRNKNVLEFNSRNRKRKFASLNRINSVDTKARILNGLEFLLTGFSKQKLKEIEALIKGSGGYILSKLPLCPCGLKGKFSKSSHRRPPIVLCPKKVSTTKFLYGCAVNSWVLNHFWLIDSIQSRSLLSPYKYLIRQVQAYEPSNFIGDPFYFKKHNLIFDAMGFLLNGKASFSSKFSNIIKHGGGQVFQSLQELVESLEKENIKTGIIIVQNEAKSFRHLKYCALEHNIQTLPMSWMIETLYCGKLVSFKKDICAPFRRIKMAKSTPLDLAIDMSQEI